jgi:hypothetical protein
MAMHCRQSAGNCYCYYYCCCRSRADCCQHCRCRQIRPSQSMHLNCDVEVCLYCQSCWKKGPPRTETSSEMIYLSMGWEQAKSGPRGYSHLIHLIQCHRRPTSYRVHCPHCCCCFLHLPGSMRTFPTVPCAACYCCQCLNQTWVDCLVQDFRVDTLECRSCYQNRHTNCAGCFHPTLDSRCWNCSREYCSYRCYAHCLAMHSAPRRHCYDCWSPTPAVVFLRWCC